MLLASEDIKQKQNERTTASLFPQCPCRGRLFAAGVHVFIQGRACK